MDKFSKIYVAGHNGLVGSAILGNLISNGYKNIVVKTSKELDLRIQQDVEFFFKNERPEYVFIAAAKVGGISANNSLRAQFIYDNIMIQSNIIHFSWKYNVKKLLFLGSTCIYPKDCPQPIIEEYLLTSQLEYTNEPYAIAKIAGLKMCESYNIQYGTNFLSLMPTNLYGPNDNFDLESSHVLPALIRKIYLGKCLEIGDWSKIYIDFKKRPLCSINHKCSKEEILGALSKYGIYYSNSNVNIKIWGDGKPLREFLWSEDLADACIYVMNNINFKDLINIGNIKNTHLNVGTGKELSILELAQTIKSSLKFNGELVFDESKPNGTFRKLTNSSKINDLGWHPKVNIDLGIKKIIKWYAEN